MEKTVNKAAIGVGDFKELVSLKFQEGEKTLLFDKTLLIRDIVNDPVKFMLFARPRRFGKTVNMSMLKYFFSTKEDIFSTLKISQYPEIMEEYQGKIPVIFLTLKDVIGRNYSEMIDNLEFAIKNAIKQIEGELDFLEIYLKKDKLSEQEMIQVFFEIAEKLYKHYNTPVLFILDEYDTPINNAYVENYFNEAIGFFRMFFGQNFKDNPYLYKGIFTGINRIARENIFSSLNSMKIYDIRSIPYSHYFGITEDELNDLNLPPQKRREIKKWYNGYSFGGTTIYNPWSVLSYIADGYLADTHWANTGGMSMIQKILSPNYSSTLDRVLHGEKVKVCLNDRLLYSYLQDNEDAFLNLMYSAGYLTSATKRRFKDNIIYLKVTNYEVKLYLTHAVLAWFANERGESYWFKVIDAFIAGEAAALEEFLTNTILETFSFHDLTPSKQEAFYHGFILGISLAVKDKYIIKSNRESGYGRYDIAWVPKKPEKLPGILIELKVNNISEDAALTQIEKNKYNTELLQHGCKEIISFGIHFNGKKIKVRRG